MLKSHFSLQAEYSDRDLYLAQSPHQSREQTLLLCYSVQYSANGLQGRISMKCENVKDLC